MTDDALTIPPSSDAVLLQRHFPELSAGQPLREPMGDRIECYTLNQHKIWWGLIKKFYGQLILQMLHKHNIKYSSEDLVSVVIDPDEMAFLFSPANGTWITCPKEHKRLHAYWLADIRLIVLARTWHNGSLDWTFDTAAYKTRINNDLELGK